MELMEVEENSQQHNSIILKTEHESEKNEKYSDNNVKNSDVKNQYLCDGCNKSFDSPHQLQEHVENVHEGSKKKPKICPICGIKRFYNNIQRHIKSHDKKFPCEKCSNVKFISQEELTEHFKKYHNEVQCDICGKTIYRSQSFTSLMADLRQDINRVSSYSKKQVP